MPEPFTTGPAGADALVICAHGTDDPEGRQTTLDIAAAAAARLPDVRVSCAYVDVQEPSLDAEVARLVAAGRRVAVVPVLLTTGFHVRVDVGRAERAHPGHVASSGPLGPHPLLVEALRGRLLESGAAPDATVVVAVAGSRREDAREAGLSVGAALAGRWVGPVSVGFLAAAEPLLPDAVAAARAASPGPVVVASYLTGRGFFHRLAGQAGGDVLTEPLADHPALIDLVIQRFHEASARLPPLNR